MTGATRLGDDERMVSTVDVLLVDDDHRLLDLTATYFELAEQPFDVATATSVDGALTHLEGGRPDAIVSDYDMPGRDGLEFLTLVRAEYSHLPFVLFTNVAREELPAGERAGLTDYLRKSVGGEQFSVLIERILTAVDGTGDD